MQTMFYHAASNTHLGLGEPFVLDEVQYPPNWLELAEPADIKALGLVPVKEVGARKDDTFYDNKQELKGATLTVTATPKPLVTLMAGMIGSVKQTANELLSSTDWQVIRKAERGIDIDDTVKTFRASVVQACEDHEAYLLEQDDIEGLIAFKPEWPAFPG